MILQSRDVVRGVHPRALLPAIVVIVIVVVAIGTDSRHPHPTAGTCAPSTPSSSLILLLPDATATTTTTTTTWNIELVQFGTQLRDLPLQRTEPPVSLLLQPCRVGIARPEEPQAEVRTGSDVVVVVFVAIVAVVVAVGGGWCGCGCGCGIVADDGEAAEYRPPPAGREEGRHGTAGRAADVPPRVSQPSLHLHHRYGLY